jgi:hypothetical protein
MIRPCMMSLGAVTIAACCSSNTPPDAGACADIDSVTTAISVPAVDPVTADLTVYGSVQTPAGVSVFNVFLAVVGESSFNVPGALPTPTVVATSDAGEFTTWHAKLPYAVMVAPLDTLPGKIVIVAIPSLDCAIEPSKDPHAIGVSRPLTINRPPAAVAQAANEPAVGGRQEAASTGDLADQSAYSAPASRLRPSSAIRL